MSHDKHTVTKNIISCAPGRLNDLICSEMRIQVEYMFMLSFASMNLMTSRLINCVNIIS